MPPQRAQPRPVRHGSGGSALRTDPRLRQATPRAAGVLAFLLAMLPASPSTAATLLGESTSAAGDGPVLESAPAAGSPRQRAVFVCQQEGAPVFTDRPCGSATGQRSITVDAPAAGAAPSTAPPRPRASTRPRLQPDGPADAGRTAEARCAALRRQLDELDARMRDGYSSREAARLWTRWRDLKARLRTERC